MPKIQNFKMYINGEWVDSSSGKKIQTLNPENNITETFGDLCN